MLSGSIWPVHLNPQNDEILSSWIVRNSLANACKVYTYTKFSIPGREIWARDVDKSACEYIVQCLSEKTGKSINLINQTLLFTYKGVISKQYSGAGFVPGVLYLGVKHRKRTRFALQYCSLCLSEDAHPYFRKKWRLAYTVCCPKHQSLLDDRCRTCGQPVSYHRLDYSNKGMFSKDSLAICSECGSDYRSFKTVSVSDWLVSKQVFINNLIDNKHQRLSSDVVVTSCDFFSVLRNFMYISTSSSYSYGLQKELFKRWPYVDGQAFRDKPRSVEYMDIKQRQISISLAMYMFDNWPDRFVDVCQLSRRGKWWIMHDDKNIPPWLRKVLLTNRT